MTVFEDRLRGELRAEAELITPESIAPLRLPGDTGDRPGPPRRGGARAWPWVAPLAAAAAVAVAIAGTFALAHTFPGPGERPAGPQLSSLPAYYGYTVRGDIYSYASHGTQFGMSSSARYVKVRDTVTGRLVTTVVPPKPYNNFQAITANASGTVFVLGAMRYWQRRANAPPSIVKRNQVTPLKFLAVRINPAGQAHVSDLALSVSVTPRQQPSIALSPAGTRLALAFGGRGRPAVLDVISLGTGQVRRWVSAPVPWTPQLNMQGAWTADGRTVVLQEWRAMVASAAAAAQRAALRPQPPAATQVDLIDTLAPGGDLGGGRRLALRSLAGENPPWQVFVTPDGTKLIGSSVTGSPGPLGSSHGELAVYSASTGALRQWLAPWTWRGADPRGGHGGFARELLAWSSASGSQLVLLRPRDDLNILGVLTGGRFRTTGAPLPRPPGYQELQYALRTAGQMVW